MPEPLVVAAEHAGQGYQLGHLALNLVNGILRSLRYHGVAHASRMFATQTRAISNSGILSHDTMAYSVMIQCLPVFSPALNRYVRF